MGNIITLPGRLGRDAEVRQTANGTKILSFSLAVDERTGKQAEDTRTDWYSVTSFLPNHTGKFAEYLKKGYSVIVTGNLRPGTYIGRDGQTHIDLNVNAFQIDFMNLGRREDNNQQGGQTNTPTQQPAGQAPTWIPTQSGPVSQPAYNAAADAEPTDDLPF